MDLQGKELFSEKKVRLGSEKRENKKVYKIEFSFDSLMELEDLKNGDFQAVFDMFEKDFNTSNMCLSLWACLLTHHEEEFEDLLDEKEIKKAMKKFINAENFLTIKLSLIETFGAFWKKAKESKDLPDEYKKLFEEMEKNNKKK